ncbi:flagellar transcriptional regulator FlhD [Thiohalobacter sp. IOR34]|uniref:flagellar transcriptional regulator FlhD n=1 Tax=Thiohalobacter sp. IOR34 TaxID=3057176 RepID=UPI00176A64C4|nr:flagellar transcriptional regulator FlhD [Thiohalobacter sp. IOR34]MBI1194991.1 hypothetical protein [Gammaproteobacteria bacterium]WJW74654.1 flagellar transcriptional regulator FlhD [Thiohalobacter sp. IOR34]HHH48365.1 hypothetical protein [Gammaproteobacteria bacterium]
MSFDFSQVNLQYFIQARDLAKQDPELVATMLGIPDEMARLLAGLTPKELAHVSLIKQPLLLPRQEAWWWSRLFTAVREGRAEEIEAIMEHAPLITVP